MAESFSECLKALKNFTGLKLLLGITLISWIYLFIKEKRKAVRAVLVFLPLVVMLIFLCPFSKTLFDALGQEGDIYYRFLWMIPFGIITSFGIVRFAGNSRVKRIIALLVSSLIIIFSGSLVYSNAAFFKSQNLYGIPKETIDIVDYIKSVDDHERMTILPSSDIIASVRQYDANMMMPYGRDFFDAPYGYVNAVFDAYENPQREMKPIVFGNLVEATRNADVEYIVMHIAVLNDGKFEEAGLELLANIDDHLIFRDPVISEKVADYVMHD
ncbi:MAG: hypothetical protein MJ133_04025 [Lachnospiraceae bacterium]|nr:hypothetical protein [Lachnospiraceae bacterium]